MAVDSAGRYVERDGLLLLHPAEQVFQEMLTGWRHQQLSRNLSHSTILAREQFIVRFMETTNEWPWAWTPSHVDEYFGDARSIRGIRQSTVRSYQNSLRMFCGYITSADYGWPAVCEQHFGQHPAQVCFEWNTAQHVQESETDPRRRAFTRQELQDFFDRADDEVDVIRSLGRKGWHAAYRDSVLFKTAYAWGLRRNEVRHLQTVDFSRNPHAPEFGRNGVLQVRWGKANKGSPPKRRSVLTVFDWSAEVVADWLEVGYPHNIEPGLDLFVSERGTLVPETALLARFRRYCDDLALSPGLDFHSLRRSYVTHLIEAGMDAYFVQKQVGHEHASTTAIYTCVSEDYRVRTLRAALDGAVRSALSGMEGE